MEPLSDTDPEAARVQMDLLRRASPARRLRLALSLSESVLSLSRAGIARGLPGVSPREIGLEFVRLHYGEELADEVRRHLGPALTAPDLTVIHLETMLKVDVFVSKGRPFDRRAMERARAAAPQNTDECPLPLASAEDTILAKLEWFRRGGEASERQWTDVLGVLRAGGASLDRRYLEDGARELAVTDLLDRALGEAGAAS